MEFRHRIAALHSQVPDHERLRNRELSWLDFNQRVLEEAWDHSVPVLEKLKFLAIFASNLDEFFMVRVAFIRRQIEAGITRRSPDGLLPGELLDRITVRVHEAHESLGRCYRNHIMPALASAGIRIVTDYDATNDQRSAAGEYFSSNIASLLTPVALDVTLPFPHLENAAMYFCIELEPQGGSAHRLVLMRLPTHVTGRFISVPAAQGEQAVMMVDDVIRVKLQEFFREDRVTGCYAIKVLRDSDLLLDDADSRDLLHAIVDGLQRRKRGPATRLIHDPAIPRHMLEQLSSLLQIDRKHVFEGARYHSFSDFMQLPAIVDRPDLLYPPMPPRTVARLEGAASLFREIRNRDILLHHPYQEFSYVIRFLEEAADDPDTVSVSATLYRVSSDSRIAGALARAARNGKQVTVLVELKARFDEERNIGWARVLGEAGVRVIYGVNGLKTHCKLLLVVRKEGQGAGRYCHLGTGNYNDRTARVYSDFGLFTAHEGLTADVARVFNRISGEENVKHWNHLLVAPRHMRDAFVERIEREAYNATLGRPAGIIAKMNSLVDPDMIDALYAAGQCGVSIRLIVRGVCCLRPGVPGLSENIEVTSIIDRYLEHARVYQFENGGNPELFLASADWMPRNLNSRIEVAFPVLDPDIYREIMGYIQLQLGDTEKARILRPDGTNVRRSGTSPCRAQWASYDAAKKGAGEPAA